MHHRNAGSACGGGDFWHEQILEAEIVAAEHEDEGEEVFEFMKKAFDEIDSKPAQAFGQSGAAGDTESEESEGEERDEVGPLRNVATKLADPSRNAALELQKAHVIIIVDTSGSMRTVDVKPTHGEKPVSRLQAVTASLSEFFDVQQRSSSLHVFSMLSFSQKSCVHFVNRSAREASPSQENFGKLAASLGTHYVVGLEAAERLAKMPPGGIPHLLVFSDGRPADGKQMIQFAQRMLSDLHAIGFGDGLDFDALPQLTSIGCGTFAPSGKSVIALNHAFASVTSSVTETQTVASRSIKSSAFTFNGLPGQSSADAAKDFQLRKVDFEPSASFHGA